ncbi:MAG: glycosyltransferase family 4 protein [Anaerolineae bacterium]
MLIVAPQLGFTPNGEIVPGGLLNFGRCVARAVASFPGMKKLGVWCQVDMAGSEAYIERMLRVYADDHVELDIRCFGGSQTKLTVAVSQASITRTYDHVMYLLVNQSVLANLPFHLPYSVWEIGRELFEPVSRWKYEALNHANHLLSISKNTSDQAVRNNPGLRPAQIVHLCVEPPLYERELEADPVTQQPFNPAERDPAVLILGNLHREYLYKGHAELIQGWTEVHKACPQAELWIGGDGDGRSVLEGLVKQLPFDVGQQIKFLGRLSDSEVQKYFSRCRVFAMPSRGEGFGLVFVEAARYGVPCIGGKYDSAKEIVLHGETGLLTEQTPHDVASACVQLLSDDVMAKCMGEAGRARYLNNFRYHHFRERLLHAMELDQ